MSVQSFSHSEGQAEATEGLDAPLLRFRPAAPQGFGDRQNSWAWSMVWWRGRLYVGTNRAWFCAERAGMKRAFPLFVKYPPNDPDVACAPDPTDLPLQAEIWCWTPESDSWERLYQSPRDVPIPGSPGKFTAREVGFRHMSVITEPDGTEALYVSGVNSRFIFRPVPAPRLLRSTDGRSFAPVPADPGTFLGTLDRCAFRTSLTYKGRFFVSVGNIQGDGVLLESPDPASGNSSFRQVTPPGMPVFEIALYNGYLYVGGRDIKHGYTVLRTRAEGEPPYHFETVIPGGAFLAEPSRGVISMYVYKGRLYVGTDRPAELIRINPDDSWDLVFGTPRPTPGGMKYPLSGLDAGFSNWLNGHIWRMQSYQGRLYIGTWNMSTYFNEYAEMREIVKTSYGLDFYETDDGYHFYPITTDGFGDRFNYGLRSFAATPHGLFAGIVNSWYGLGVYRGTPAEGGASDGPAEPGRPRALEAESAQGRVVLSWESPSPATRFQVWRASVADERHRIEAHPVLAGLLRLVRTILRTTANIYLPPLPKQLWVPGAYALVGTTDGLSFVDTGVEPGRRYLYYVRAEGPAGTLSPPSSVAAAPWPGPPVTFAGALDLLARGAALGGASPAGDAAGALRSAQQCAATGDLAGAERSLAEARAQIERALSGAPEASPLEDARVWLQKLARRLTLAAAGHVDPASL